MKLQIWSVDAEGNLNDLLDETDVTEEEFEMARNDRTVAKGLLNDLYIGKQNNG